MIACKKCEFETNTLMRHSLIKNCCPSCGSALFGDLHMRRLELLKRKILEQEFSQELNNDLIFDISLFMLTEFFATKKEPEEGDAEATTEEGSEGDVAVAAEEDYDSIRDEVRNEILLKIDDTLEDVDTDLKVARLKRIAKEKAIGGSGPSVRRLSD